MPRFLVTRQLEAEQTWFIVAEDAVDAVRAASLAALPLVGGDDNFIRIVGLSALEMREK